ncbi:MAG TPA: carboxylesterase/lipase family protein [Moraxellaceae bacterium]|nr:carboxylesterase/lipase family protein [Moraxellaceae bacterium]
MSDSSSAAPQVLCRLGHVAGVARSGVEQFRGIPYAQPLRPGRRVAAPEPVAAWTGVRDATRWAPAAPQEDIPFMGTGAFGEDCLALNIWRPQHRPGPLPVMVWIHGGGFATGASHQALYDASALARDNGVVVVSLNYRLGILGFGEWASLGIADAVSNAGLRDQILALEWVRDHIADFGGDPGNVTVFGESAGGMSIACLLASPLARDLFRRAIIQSGSPDHVVSPAEAARITQRFAEAAGGDASACLRGPLDAIVAAQRACFAATVNRGDHARPVPQFGMTLMPRFGDDVLPEPPLAALRRGASADIPVLLGTTVDEWTLFYLAPQAMGRGQARPEPDAARLLHEFERTLPGGGAAMLEAYRGLMPDVPGSEVFCAYETDRMFRIPTVRLAEARFGQAAPTWHYLFDWPCAWNRRLRSCHVMEVPFVFGITSQPTGQFFTGGGETAERLSAQVRAAWTAFARGHAPAGPGWPEWPPYAEGARATLRIGAETVRQDDPEADRRRLWQGII